MRNDEEAEMRSIVGSADGDQEWQHQHLTSVSAIPEVADSEEAAHNDGDGPARHIDYDVFVDVS